MPDHLITLRNTLTGETREVPFGDAARSLLKVPHPHNRGGHPTQGLWRQVPTPTPHDGRMAAERFRDEQKAK